MHKERGAKTTRWGQDITWPVGLQRGELPVGGCAQPDVRHGVKPAGGPVMAHSRSVGRLKHGEELALACTEGVPTIVRMQDTNTCPPECTTKGTSKRRTVTADS